MCTGIAIKGKHFYFGRNMDLDHAFGEHVVITPRRYRLAFRKTDIMETHYAMIGMAAVADAYPLYAEAVNEKGLCIAGLNFPGNAYYPCEAEGGKIGISPFELIPYLLGQCASLTDAKNALQNITVVDIPFRDDIPVTPLHWLIADRNGSIVLESTQSGMRIYDNPTGVLTNNPPFDFHLDNFSHYAHLTNRMPERVLADRFGLEPYSMGIGAAGLPGDYSSASRFAKLTWLCQYAPMEEETTSCEVVHFFRLLASVAPLKGSVLTNEGKCHYTTYSCCMDVDEGIYYYSTYFNPQIIAVDMRQTDLEDSRLRILPLHNQPQFVYENLLT